MKSVFGLFLISYLVSSHEEEDLYNSKADTDLNNILKKIRRQHLYEGIEENIQRCGTQELPTDDLIKTENDVMEYKNSMGPETLARIMEKSATIDVYFHIIYASNGLGNVSDRMIRKQIEILNNSFNGVVEGTNSSFSECPNLFTYEETYSTPFKFKLREINRVQDDKIFDLDSKDSFVTRQNMRVGTCSDLNIFMGFSSYSGFSFHPQDCPLNGDPEVPGLHDAVMINYETLPNGTGGRYTEGDTLVHEVGHWLGLHHTFHNGCSNTGDFVSDTSPEKTLASGCPIGRDTCPGSGEVDPIHNFMDYTDDCCMYKFTEGQSERMVFLAEKYRGITSKKEIFDRTNEIKSSILRSNSPTCKSNEFEFSFEISTDLHSDETHWELLNDSDESLVMQRDDYRFYYTTYYDSICLSKQSCYTFTIFDSYGDGICCMEGTGSYYGFVNGKEIFSGGEFGFDKRVSFCGEQGNTETPTPIPTFSLSSVPSSLPTDAPSTAASFHPTLQPSAAPSIKVPTWEKISFDSFDIGYGLFATNGKYAGRKDMKRSGGASLWIGGNAGSDSSIQTKNPIDVSSYNEVKLTFMYMAQQLKRGETLMLEYQDQENGLSDWEVAKSLVYATDFTQLRKWHNVIVLVDSHSLTSVNIRFRCQTSNIRYKFFIDDVKLLGKA